MCPNSSSLTEPNRAVGTETEFTGANVTFSVCAAGSKSDGQKSPSDSVFLRMDEIPYIREDRSETEAHSGTESC